MASVIVLETKDNSNVCAWLIADEPHLYEWNYYNAPGKHEPEKLVWQYWVAKRDDPTHNVYYNPAAAVGGVWYPGKPISPMTILDPATNKYVENPAYYA